MTTVTKCSLSFYFNLLPTNRQNGLSLGAPWSMVNKTEIENLVFEKKNFFISSCSCFLAIEKKFSQSPVNFMKRKPPLRLKERY